jgi:hypothetical protein
MPLEDKMALKLNENNQHDEALVERPLPVHPAWRAQ